MYCNLYPVLSRRMRNLWYYGFLALMYVFTTWAVETFGEQQTSMGNPLFKILIPPPPPGEKGPVPTGKRVRREGESQALLETMSLSYGGNYYVSESIKQVNELSGLLAVITPDLGPNLMNLRGRTLNCLPTVQILNHQFIT